MIKENAGSCGYGKCSGCELGQKLNCRYDPALVGSFVLSQLPYLLHLLREEVHAFYYQHVIKCMAPNPCPKTWRYRPEPMKFYEKLIIVSFVAFILSFPLIVHAHTVAFMAQNRELFSPLELVGAGGLGLAIILACIQFCYILTQRFCERCVNLSCPFNRVSKALAEEYLRKNQKMGGAWNNRR